MKSLNQYSISRENIIKHNFRKWYSLAVGQKIDGQNLMVDLWESCHMTPVNFYSEPNRYNVDCIHRGWCFWSCVMQWPQCNNSPITRCLKSVCRPSSSPLKFSFSSQYCFWTNLRSNVCRQTSSLYFKVLVTSCAKILLFLVYQNVNFLKN